MDELSIDILQNIDKEHKRSFRSLLGDAADEAKAD